MRAALRPGAFALGLLLAAALGAPAAAIEDTAIFTFLEVEAEHRSQGGANSLDWDADAWVGGDYEKLWLKSEGSWEVHGPLDHAEVQALYSRLISDFWDAQLGVRYDFGEGPDTGHLAAGVQGLAKYFFEIDAAAFLSHRGDLTARFEAEYELLITQRLIAEPRLEVNLSAQDVKKLGIGAGISDIELGLRLRYELAREFAPYVGVVWERKLFKTADFARDEGEEVDELAFVAGVRFWF